MNWSIVEFIAGLVLTGLTIADVFSSILVPGPTDSPLRFASRIRKLSLPVWHWMSQVRSGGKRRLSNSFAPMLFSFAFIGWMLLLLLGFALMLHASAREFTPPLHGFGMASYVSGAYLLTIGTNEVQPHGFMRALLLMAALAGFGVITATITFILEIQANLHERDKEVLKLSGLAGKPPSGVGLLENFAALGMRDELGQFFREWAAWSAAILNSHASFSVLVYFHSVDSESDWVVALQVVLDASALLTVMTEENCGAAVFLHRAGSRTAAHLADLFRLEAEDPFPAQESTLRSVSDRLQSAGYGTKIIDAELVTRFVDLRGDYAGRLNALARHLGSRPCPLEP
jgi:hypothetical protein